LKNGVDDEALSHFQPTSSTAEMLAMFSQLRKHETAAQGDKIRRSGGRKKFLAPFLGLHQEDKKWQDMKFSLQTWDARIGRRANCLTSGLRSHFLPAPAAYDERYPLAQFYPHRASKAQRAVGSPVRFRIE